MNMQPVKSVRNARVAIRLWLVIAGLSIAGCAAVPGNVSDDRIECSGKEGSAACEQNAVPSTGEARQPSSARWTIVVKASWKDDSPGLDKPRGAAAQVASKLGASAVIGGAFVLAGDPIRAAVYGGTLATFGVIDGVKSGRAGRAVHRKLDAAFSPGEFGAMVRGTLQQRLVESGVRPVPRVLAADSGLSLRGGPWPGNSIELTFEKAALASTRHAWQFHRDNKPELTLLIQARTRILRAGGKQPIFDGTVEYKGRRVLNGEEQPFQAEVQRAADYIAQTTLRQLAGVEDFATGGDAGAQTETGGPGPVGAIIDLFPDSAN